MKQPERAWMTDAQILDAITARLAACDKEQDEHADIVNNSDYWEPEVWDCMWSDIMGRLQDDITELIEQRQAGWRRRFN